MKHCRMCGGQKDESEFEETRHVCRLCRNRQKTTQRFGITTDDYNDLFNKQGGCCAICGNHQSNFTKALAIDHCHKTGRVRGLLCMICNTALGKFNDDELLLHAAIKYLRSNEGRL